jgi:hypothetical protein
MFICLSFGCAGGLKENIGHLDILTDPVFSSGFYL